MIIGNLINKIKIWFYFKRKIKNWGKGIMTFGIPSSIINGSQISIGDNCRLNSGIVLNATNSNIIIGNNVTISSNVQIIAATYDIDKLIESNGLIKKHIRKPIIIGNNVWICAGSIILPGVTIADNVIIGAGSVINKSITEKNVLVCGNPGKIVKRYRK